MRFGIISIAGLALAFGATLSGSASAQTQEQQDRLNRVAQLVVTSPMCGRLGMNLDPDLPTKAEAGFNAEIASWQLDPTIAQRLQSEALARQGNILKIDLESASNGAETDAQLRGARSIILGYGQTCIAATTDPIFSSLITLPVGYDLDKAATDLADTMLESGGLASWQTPRIQARGDLMMLAGTCRSKIGPARSDALVQEFGQSDDPRVRNYYSKSFDEGLSDPTIISTLEGCNRAIASYRLEAK